MRSTIKNVTGGRIGGHALYVSGEMEVDVDGFFVTDIGKDAIHFAPATVVQQLNLSNEEILKEILSKLQSVENNEAKATTIKKWFSDHGAAVGVGTVTTLVNLANNPAVIAWLKS